MARYLGLRNFKLANLQPNSINRSLVAVPFQAIYKQNLDVRQNKTFQS